MRKFIEEFKEFISRGNVLDLAIGVVIGGAFTAIVTSLVDDLINPIIGLLCGKDFSNLSAVFFDGQVELRYGAFIMAVVNFLIIALVLFCIIKTMNKAMNAKKKEEEEAAPTTKVCPFCKSEISIEATRCPNCTSELNE